jgi:hypothetical protein
MYFLFSFTFCFKKKTVDISFQCFISQDEQWIISDAQRKFYKEVFKGWATTGFLTGTYSHGTSFSYPNTITLCILFLLFLILMLSFVYFILFILFC